MIGQHKEEHYVHRLEAFSDIVIGFTLAQIGAALIVPTHASALFNPYWLVSFAWTFAVVCLMWWMHNRLFRTVFSPTPLAVVLNFLLLALIVLMVYFAELMLHPHTYDDAMMYGRFYYTTLASVFGLIALLSYLGAIARRSEVDPEIGARALRSGFVNAVSAAFTLLVVCVSLFFPASGVWFPIMGTSVLVGFILGRLLASVAGV